jgi:hypothetical protein
LKQFINSLEIEVINTDILIEIKNQFSLRGEVYGSDRGTPPVVSSTRPIANWSGPANLLSSDERRAMTEESFQFIELPSHLKAFFVEKSHVV